ncbi:MAG TPA: cobalamin-independent methionine synthase II family protein, partial [Xanthobacteraceae bacterium]|nr:cobalamin-independent methionine synthase II family protein [Xanthobacteraceae bacterium]
MTTHCGSIPRPPELVDMLRGRMEGKKVKNPELAAEVKRAVTNVVREQARHGIDIVSDGEMGKVGFIPYINERLGGFEPSNWGANESYWGKSREAQAFPGFYAWAAKQAGTAGNVGLTRWVATGPIKYKGQDALKTDIDNLKFAMTAAGVTEAFMPSISPGNAADWHKNEYYDKEDDYLFAVADALHDEYQAIVDSGLLLQIDDPHLVTYYVMHPELSLKECRAWAAKRVEAINRALKGIPREKVRYHTCYSINMGPRVHDMELKDIIDVMLKVRAGAFSFEAANPRHEHEWKVWQNVKLPAETVLIPGVITNSTNLVEHPELVSDRIQKFVSVVGRDNVIAGADCGFASFAVSFEIHSEVVWAKFEALTEGAKLASKCGSGTRRRRKPPQRRLR